MRTLIALLLIGGVCGCVSNPVECTVSWDADEFGTPVPSIDGEPYPLTDAEKDAIGNAYVARYCPIAHPS